MSSPSSQIISHPVNWTTSRKVLTGISFFLILAAIGLTAAWGASARYYIISIPNNTGICNSAPAADGSINCNKCGKVKVQTTEPNMSVQDAESKLIDNHDAFGMDWVPNPATGNSGESGEDSGNDSEPDKSLGTATYYTDPNQDKGKKNFPQHMNHCAESLTEAHKKSPNAGSKYSAVRISERYTGILFALIATIIAAAIFGIASIKQ